MPPGQILDISKLLSPGAVSVPKRIEVTAYQLPGTGDGFPLVRATFLGQSTSRGDRIITHVIGSGSVLAKPADSMLVSSRREL